ncbi:MAG: amino acid adenylation domain-containing protein [Candidatus Omnitrophota bacterium]
MPNSNTNETRKNIQETGLEIAVIGMAGKFPGASDLDQYWKNLQEGVESITWFTDDELRENGIGDRMLENPNYIKAYGTLEDKVYFDASFFGYSPKEAEVMDPVTRLFHECSWEALEDAGYDAHTYNGAIGMYAGASDGFDWKMLRAMSILSNPDSGDMIHMTENSLLVSTRVSHKLNLKGPGITLFTACSTGIVAIHTASRALLTGECQMALAGAGSASAFKKTGYLYQEGMILSPDGHCSPFDAKAGGTVYGDGIGIVVLKRLKQAEADGDTIRAVIKASAINNDGSMKSSYTAPGKQRIIDVLRTAFKLARVEPEAISYIETHGTGTPLGDAIEVGALKDVFQRVNKGHIGLGSVKSNLGHLDVAAGIAGFIKAILILNHRLIPPSLHFHIPNPALDLVNSPFYVNAERTTIEENNNSHNPLRVAVCAFGFGGTNSFAILERPSLNDSAVKTDECKPSIPYLFTLSARTDSALEKMTVNLLNYLKTHPGLRPADVAYTLQVGRRDFSRRRMWTGSSIEDTIHVLSTLESDRVLTAECKDIKKISVDGLGIQDIGMSWLNGGEIDWQSLYNNGALYSGTRPRRIPLPAYPFERQYYWIDVANLSIDLFGGRKENGPVQVRPSVYQRPKLSSEYAAPRDDLERALAGVWQKFFAVEEIGVNDDFFELGGDSLKAITVVTEIHKQLNVRVPISAFFNSTSIAALAEHIRHSAPTGDYSNIEPIEEREYYPLSSVQKRIYLLHQMAGETTGYNMPLIFELEGELDLQRVEDVFQTMVKRHESLRTSFHMIDDEPVQVVHDDPEFKVEFYDLPDLATEVTEHTEGERKKLRSEEGKKVREVEGFIRYFDLTKVPLIRATVIRKEEKIHLLAVDMHHIASDGSSVGILIREFMALYAGEVLPPLRVQYKDYAYWQTSETQQALMKKQEAFWLAEFEGEVPVLQLPLDYSRPSEQSFEGRTVIFEISGEDVEALKAVTASEDATLFMGLLALFYIWLMKLSNQEDMVVGVPLAGRTHADLQPMIGMLVNTLAMRNYPGGKKTFRSFLGEVKQRTLAAFENQDYLFEDLVENVGIRIERDTGRNPLFDVMFTLRNFQSQYDANSQFELPGLTVKLRDEDRGAAIVDLSMQVEDLGGSLRFLLEYCTRLFKPETMERFIDYFRRVFRASVCTPDVNMSQIEIVSEEEKHRVLVQFNQQEENYPCDQTMHGLFDAQVEKTPDGLALIGPVIGNVEEFGAMSPLIQLTYSHLNKCSSILAGMLREKGMGPGAVVALKVERSIEMVIALLGILKTGAAYLPLNPKNPEERTQYMLKDSGASILITNEDIEELKEIGPRDMKKPAAGYRLSAANLAYIIYTSGSTGRPKGVAVPHRNVSPLLHWGYRHLRMGVGDRTIQNLSYFFDWSVMEMFNTLTAGAGLVVAEEEVMQNPDVCIDFMNRQGITALYITPTQFVYFLNTGKALRMLRYLCIGAEKVTHDVVQRGYRVVKDDCRIFNMYGPTEATVVSAVFEVIRDRQAQGSELNELSVPIGTGVGNTLFIIVDQYLNPCPVGAIGELYIGGDGVALGYLNNPELTNERFLNKSFWKSRNLFSKRFLAAGGNPNFYKTGDLCRWLETGDMEYMGRIDHQVKIRGQRIELGEIESCVLTSGGGKIKDVIVMDRTDDRGEKYLCAYVVLKHVEADFAEEIKAKLLLQLPAYMVPSYYVLLENLPLNPNGKVDRRALPEPERHRGILYEAPGNEIEEKLVRMWSEILGIDQGTIGVNDNFFERGGHSLRASVLVSKVSKEFRVALNLGKIFKTPTVREIATYILAAEWKNAGGDSVNEGEEVVL